MNVLSQKVGVKKFWIFFASLIVSNVILRQMFQRGLISEELFSIYGISALILFIVVGFKRVQDAGYSGFLIFIPLVNLILASMPAKKGD